VTAAATTAAIRIVATRCVSPMRAHVTSVPHAHVRPLLRLSSCVYRLIRRFRPIFFFFVFVFLCYLRPNGVGHEQDRLPYRRRRPGSRENLELFAGRRSASQEDVFHVHAAGVSGVGPRTEMGVGRRSRPVYQIRYGIFIREPSRRRCCGVCVCLTHLLIKSPSRTRSCSEHKLKLFTS